MALPEYEYVTVTLALAEPEYKYVIVGVDELKRPSNSITDADCEARVVPPITIETVPLPYTP